MTVRFNPYIVDDGLVGREEQNYLAATIARRVQMEIATSKFITDATEREMREGPRMTIGGYR